MWAWNAYAGTCVTKVRESRQPILFGFSIVHTITFARRNWLTKPCIVKPNAPYGTVLLRVDWAGTPETGLDWTGLQLVTDERIWGG